MKDPRRNLQAYRNATARLKARTKKHNGTCWLCGKGFDWTLPYTDAMAFTSDHVRTLAQGGDILGTLMPAHRSCNSRRNDGKKEERVPTTRRW